MSDANFDASLERFLRLAQDMIDAHHGKHFPNNPRVSLSTEKGRRYVRIVSGNGMSRSAWAFVDATNGDILKSDGWKGPAKGKRGNIFGENPLSGVTVYGAVYHR